MTVDEWIIAATISLIPVSITIAFIIYNIKENKLRILSEIEFNKLNLPSPEDPKWERTNYGYKYGPIELTYSYDPFDNYEWGTIRINGITIFPLNGLKQDPAIKFYHKIRDIKYNRTLNQAQLELRTFQLEQKVVDLRGRMIDTEPEAKSNGN